MSKSHWRESIRIWPRLSAPKSAFFTLCSTASMSKPGSSSRHNCPYSIFHLRKKSMMFQTAARERTVSATLISPSPFHPVHQPFSPVTHDSSWNFWLHSIHSTTGSACLDFWYGLWQPPWAPFQHSGLPVAMFVPNPHQVPFHIIAVWKRYGQMTRAGKLDSPKSWSQSLG